MPLALAKGSNVQLVAVLVEIDSMPVLLAIPKAPVILSHSAVFCLPFRGVVLENIIS
jgi:hypothetical protein